MGRGWRRRRWLLQPRRAHHLPMTRGERWVGAGSGGGVTDGYCLPRSRARQRLRAVDGMDAQEGLQGSGSLRPNSLETLCVCFFLFFMDQRRLLPRRSPRK
ncbi:hypothetical protein I4F81_009934 [Pyropia yezoensis]|uniref:Uncharacterized protein n=1 Tax=Pyropia yezoensis TaxID=2788 RepID=A0ACC3CB82_PYRYE|nr:hypothetical protein I4F81_009934 [Neopyropia yezoensis]